MMKRILARGLMISMILGVFALGFLVGTVNQRYADAQKIPGVGDVLDKAGKSGGPFGFGGTARLVDLGDADPCQRAAEKSRDAENSAIRTGRRKIVAASGASQQTA